MFTTSHLRFYVLPFSLSRSDAFKIGLALVQLLTQPDLLCGGQHQVFAALVFLYDLYKSEPFAQNPFAAVFVKYLQVKLTSLYFAVCSLNVVASGNITAKS